MTIHEQAGPSGTNLVLEGSLRLPGVARLHAALLRALESHRPVRLDCNRVDEIDLAGLQLLLSARTSFDAAGLAFVIDDAPSESWAAVCARAGIVPTKGAQR